MPHNYLYRDWTMLPPCNTCEYRNTQITGLFCKNCDDKPLPQISEKNIEASNSADAVADAVCAGLLISKHSETYARVLSAVKCGLQRH
ncbi:MAG: hypothetical protein A2V66_11870 [Ignavibacteria bacterium RBG_13_36_8]|nr:MAG: hypothetical protein A2V66_11870 [Ignavibacteria bacterium RBG_13_36_8]